MEFGDCREVSRGRSGVVFLSFKGRLWGGPLEGYLEWVERIQQ